MQLYRLTVKEHRMIEASIQFEKITQLAEGATYAASLTEPLKKFHQQKQDCHHDFESHVNELFEQLAEVMHPARAARVIAANSRIEASQAGEYLQSLQAVAESVDHAAQIINVKVNRCRSALSLIHRES
jgi:hypothetical protein